MEQGDIPYVFQRGVVRKAMEEPPNAARGRRTYFCDFAAGGDENVIGCRDGNVLKIIDAWHEKDTMLAVMRFVMNFKREGATSECIFGDNGGVGKPMIDALWKIGWEINRVDNQTPPWDRNYINRGGEMWHETSGSMRRNELVLECELEDRDELVDQFCNRRCRWNDQSRLGVEQKEKMKDRGVASPDRADALCGAWACHALIPDAKDPFTEWQEQYDQEKNEDGVPVGCWTG